MSYNIKNILDKKVIDPADILEIFDFKILSNRETLYPGLSLENFSKIFKVSKRTLSNVGVNNYSKVGMRTAVKIAQNTLGATVCTVLDFDEKRAFRRFLRQYRAKFASNTDDLNSDGLDPFEHQLLINEFINKFSNSEDVVELLCFLFSEHGLKKNQNLSDVQSVALDELLAFEYVFETGWETFKVNSEYESEFKLHPALVKSLWSVAFKHAETYLRRDKTIINEIVQNEVLKEDIPEIEKSLMESRKTLSKCIVRSREGSGEKCSVFYGRLFCELGE